MLPPSLQVHYLQAQTLQPQAPQPPVSSPSGQGDLGWAVVGQYGVGAAALLALLKAYADYQLKVATEDRVFKNKESNQDLETRERIFGSVMNQNQALSANQGQLLNTFIAKTLNQAEVTNEQINELIRTIGTLTEAIKGLSDSQEQQLVVLSEVKESIVLISSLDQKLVNGFNSAIDSLTLQTTLINQLLAFSNQLNPVPTQVTLISNTNKEG